MPSPGQELGRFTCSGSGHDRSSGRRGGGIRRVRPPLANIDRSAPSLSRRPRSNAFACSSASWTIARASVDAYSGTGVAYSIMNTVQKAFRLVEKASGFLLGASPDRLGVLLGGVDEPLHRRRHGRGFDGPLQQQGRVGVHLERPCPADGAVAFGTGERECGTQLVQLLVDDGAVVTAEPHGNGLPEDRDGVLGHRYPFRVSTFTTRGRAGRKSAGPARSPPKGERRTTR